MQTQGLIPVDDICRARSAPEHIHARHSSTEVFTIHGYGMVGTGRTPEAAKKDLLEKIRQAGEA